MNKVIFSITTLVLAITLLFSSGNFFDSKAYANRFLAFEQSFDENSPITLSTTHLVSIDPTTGATTPIGDSLESIFPGYNAISKGAAIDSTNNRMMYVNYNYDDIDESETKMIVVQNTLTGEVISQLPFNEILMPEPGIFYETSTGRFLAFEQSFDENSPITLSTTHLVSIDPTTGATTPIGDSLESIFPGYNAISKGAAIDSTNNRMMYVNYNYDDIDESETKMIVVQNTLTGEVISQLPFNEILMPEPGIFYETSTGRFLAFEQSFDENSPITLSTTHLVSIDPTTGATTPIGDSLESIFPGYNAISKGAAIDSTNNRMMYVNYNYDDIDESETKMIVVQNTLTGEVISQLPFNEILMPEPGIFYETSTSSSTETFTLNPSADTYIRSGANNRNLGAGVFMRLQASGNNRALIKFDQNAIDLAVGSGQIISAKIKLKIENTSNNWGVNGRTVDIHRLTRNWTEGNGTEADRGVGDGATWSCSIDSIIENQSKNCSGLTEWEMGQPNNPLVHPWISDPSDSSVISNGQTGVVEFDVTDDTQSFISEESSNYGWLIKKTDEGQSGEVTFGTKESSIVPELIITYQP